MNNSVIDSFLNIIKVDETKEIKKVNIFKKDIFFLKILKFVPVSIYRRYYLNLFFKDNKQKMILINYEQKDALKREISRFNIYLNSNQ